MKDVPRLKRDFEESRMSVGELTDWEGCVNNFLYRVGLQPIEVERFHGRGKVWVSLDAKAANDLRLPVYMDATPESITAVIKLAVEGLERRRLEDAAWVAARGLTVVGQDSAMTARFAE